MPPASRATRADKEKDKKEGLESKGAVAVKDGGIGGRIRRRIRKKEKDKKKDLPAYLSLPYEPTCRLLFLVATYLPLAYLPDPLPFAYLSDPLPFIVKKAK